MGTPETTVVRLMESSSLSSLSLSPSSSPLSSSSSSVLSLVVSESSSGLDSWEKDPVADSEGAFPEEVEASTELLSQSPSELEHPPSGVPSGLSVGKILHIIPKMPSQSTSSVSSLPLSGESVVPGLLSGGSVKLGGSVGSEKGTAVFLVTRTVEVYASNRENQAVITVELHGGAGVMRVSSSASSSASWRPFRGEAV